MDTTTPMVPDSVLGAALKEVTGVGYDLSTADGRKQAVAMAETLLEDQVQLDSLLAAIQKFSVENEASTALPQVLPRVKMLARVDPPNSLMDMPPTGSSEFDEYISDHQGPDYTAIARELAGAAYSLAKQNATLEEAYSVDFVHTNFENVARRLLPNYLEYSAEFLEPISIPAVQEFEKIFFEAQQTLARKSSRFPFFAVSARIINALHATFKEPSISSKNWHNYFSIDARGGSSKDLHVDSIVSGQSVYIVVQIDGKVMLKDKLTLSNRAQTVERIAATFAGEAEAGVKVLNALREATKEFVVAFK